MKHVLATLVALLAFQQAHAQYQARDLDFAAPIVYGDPLNTNSKIGSITYDLNTNTFRGLFADGNWNTLPGAFQMPTVQRFTVSGTGTYTTPANVKYIIVQMVGGGMGGSGSSTIAAANGGIGGSGAASTFGALLTASGAAQSSPTSGNPGGVPVVNSPAVDIGSFNGGPGAACQKDTITSSSGGTGGGLGGGQGTTGGAGVAGAANTGGGGSGGASPNNGISGSGGGGGAFVKALISSPASSYSYTVGGGGAAGLAGTSGNAGGIGGTGIIIVTEYYQ